MILYCCSKNLKEMMEHATQFPEEYSKVSSVQKKVLDCLLMAAVQHCQDIWLS
jgi:hypothetical protein